MDKRLGKYYYAITLNLLLWMSVAGFMLGSGSPPQDFERSILIGVAFGGFFLAALLQHWAYYDIHKSETRLSTQRPDRNRSPR